MAAPVISYKFIIIGNSGVGKTAILKRLIQNSFTEEGTSTIGVEFDSKVIAVGGRAVKLQIWDTAGQERFRSIAKTYYRNAVGVVLVFDIADRKSFEDLNSWINDAHIHCHPNASIQLIGNKSDLIQKRTVAESEAQEFAVRHHMDYIETSAKGGENIRELFVRLATSIINKGLKPMNPVVDRVSITSDIGLIAPKPQTRCC
jgi:small GTP-binding protein